MSNNLGTYPLIAGNPVTLFRVLAGDSAAEENPANPGTGFFDLWSDAEIEVYLERSGDNVYFAIAAGYRSLAGRASVEAKRVQDYDLQVNLEARSTKMLEVAADFEAQGVKAEVAEQDDDGGAFFVNIPIGGGLTDVRF